MQNLRTSSFVAYFSHLPPKEALEKCSKLQVAVDDICGDVANWKSYVGRRYGYKYSVQRPDLLTAEEWIKQATSLESYKVGDKMVFDPRINPAVNTNLYIAMLNDEGDVVVTKWSKYFLRDLLYISIPLLGLPLVNTEQTREFTYYVCDFGVYFTGPESIEKEFAKPLSEKHPSRDKRLFETADLCKQWFLELLLPYYMFYLEQGYDLSNARINNTLTDATVISDFREILENLDTAFAEPANPFQLAVNLQKVFHGQDVDYVEGMASIVLIYLPARLQAPAPTRGRLERI